MGEYDPLRTKVGDIYDDHGRKVGYVQDTRTSPLGVFLGSILLIGLLIFGAVSLAGSFFSAVGNQLKYGQFNSNEREAEFAANQGNPNFYYELAQRSQLTVGDSFAVNLVDDSATSIGNYRASFDVVNNDSITHHFAIGRVVVTVSERRRIDGDIGTFEREVVLNCSPSDNVVPRFHLTAPANTTTRIELTECGLNGSFEDPLILSAPRPGAPEVLMIDGLPVAGGPPTSTVKERVSNGLLPGYVYCLEQGPYQCEVPDQSSAPIAAVPVEDPVNAPSFLGSWSGSYTCSQGETALNLEVESDGTDGALVATFAFGPTASNPAVPVGSFRMFGASSGIGFTLAGSDWIDQPSGFEVVDLAGNIVGADGSRLEGDVLGLSGCTTFSLIRAQ